MMPKWIDLVCIQYESGGKEICTAPFGQLSAGDEVETGFDRGVVLEIESTSTGDSLYKFLRKYRNINPVKSVIKKLEVVDDGLSEE